MRVVRFEDGLAVCEAGGEERAVEVALVEVAEGDTVLVHADVALVRL
jgi:hydrogenase maturation factor